MEALFEMFMDRLQYLHGEMVRVMRGLPQEGLDWVPGPEMNSLAVLVAHTAGSERFWMGDVVMGDPSGRDRETEFRTAGLGAEALAGRLGGSLEYCRGVLAGLRVEDLGSPRESPGEGRQFTVAWILGHVLEHTALHTGHAQITRQLWEQRQG
ncbi:MAG: DinB family protein [Anaerolineae bacterium]